MIRLSLYTNDFVLAKRLESELLQCGGFELLPPCADITALMEQVAHHKPDLALLDPGPETTFAFLAKMNLRAHSKIVLWVDALSTDLAFQARALGVRGILRKNLPSELHMKCLLSVQAGGLWFEKALIENSTPGSKLSLTPGEEQLLGLVCQGLKNRELAEYLHIAEELVVLRLARLSRKVGAKSRFELVLVGLKRLAMGQCAGEAGPVAARGIRFPVAAGPGAAGEGFAKVPALPAGRN